MPFLIPDSSEEHRLRLKALRTAEAYYNATTVSEKEILWLLLQSQKQRLKEIQQLKKLVAQ